MKPLRIGVIGCGAIAQIMHIPNLLEHQQFQLVAIADAYEPVVNAVGDRYNVAHRYTDWRDLIARDDIDAVILSHSGSHHETTIAALDANKHVFVEKPLASNLRAAEQVVERARQSDRTVQLAYHKLYDPAFAYTKQQVEAMRDLGFVRSTVLHPANHLGFSPYKIYRGNGVIEEGHNEPLTFDEEVKALAAGSYRGADAALIDEALGERKGDERLRIAYGTLCGSIIHQIYTLDGFLGDHEEVISTEIWRDGLSIHTVIAYPNDIRVSIDWHYLSHLKDYREEYAFFGNYDRVAMQLPSPYFRNFPSPVIIQGGEGELSWEKKVTVSHDEAFRLELMAFYDNVTNGTTPRSSIEHALKHARLTQEIIDKAR